MTPESKKRIDRYNAKVFKKYETSNAGEMRHLCTECGSRCSIDGSVSRRGHELICNRCFDKNEEENPEFFREYFSAYPHYFCNICGEDFNKMYKWGE